MLRPGSRAWDIEKIQDLLPAEFAQKVIQTPICWEGDDDLFYWPHERSGVYSVRSAYHVCKSDREQCQAPDVPTYQPDPEIWKWIWKVKCPQKIKLFLWKACTNSLPVLDNLRKRNITETSDCPICGLQPETIEHGFLSCSWVPPVWFGSQLQWSIGGDTGQRFTDWPSHRLQALKQNMDSFDKNLSYFCCLLWNIWKNRCHYVYSNNHPEPSKVIQLTNRLHAECVTNLENEQQRVENPHHNSHFCQAQATKGLQLPPNLRAIWSSDVLSAARTGSLAAP
ncbi:Reverse transcriptase zinc-binding domain [Sesbania bispinosa]|nr:Reverse transcriptase zinc-binding domain [Sesbania bispinosa]